MSLLLILSFCYYYSRIENRERAIAMDARARREASDDMYVQYISALTNTGLGRIEEALTALERAVELEYEPELLRLDPVLATLRQEERFKRLVSKENR